MIKQTIELSESVSVIRLNQDTVTLVDSEDLRDINLHRWFLSRTKYGNQYAKRNEKGRSIYMHREIMNPPPHMEIDHINGDGLDNRKQNLRICTRSQNQRNSKKRIVKSSNFKGVCFDKTGNKWRARIYYEKKNNQIGQFDTDFEAAEAYDKKAIELFGEFARLNLPQAAGKQAKDEKVLCMQEVANCPRLS